MFEDREVTVRGTRIRYRDSGGSGPAVLLIHGIGLMLEIWEPTVAALAGRYRVISWDLPGFGRSEVRDEPYSVPFFGDFTAAFLDALGIAKVHAVGHSMGGATALAFARQHPSRLHSLTLNCAASLGRDAPFIFKLFSLPGIGGAMTKPSRANTRTALKSMYQDPSRIDPALEETWYRISCLPGNQRVFLQTLRSMTNFGGQRKELVEETLGGLPRLTVPVLVIGARNDGLIPPEHAIAAAKKIPSAKLVIIADCGHMPQLERADEFNRVLTEFLGNRGKAPGAHAEAGARG
jgi:2-hydroxy-6-oxonona-2,4-dienedioate hydrolase